MKAWCIGGLSLILGGSLLAGEVLLREDFEAPLANTREGSAGKMGVFYRGRHLWQTASKDATGPHGASVEVVSDGGNSPNHMLKFDAEGSKKREDSYSFRVADWNLDGHAAIKLSFAFRLDAGDQDPLSWGAVILTDRAGPYDLANRVPTSDEQRVHLRLHTSGELHAKGGGKGWKNNDFPLGKGKLNHVELRINGSEATVDAVKPGEVEIRLNGKKVDADLSLEREKGQRGPVALNYLEFRVFGNLHSDKGKPVTLWLDDVKIEPM